MHAQETFIGSQSAHMVVMFIPGLSFAENGRDFEQDELYYWLRNVTLILFIPA
jgi:hypothetical protein